MWKKENCITFLFLIILDWYFHNKISLLKAYYWVTKKFHFPWWRHNMAHCRFWEKRSFLTSNYDVIVHHGSKTGKYVKWQYISYLLLKTELKNHFLFRSNRLLSNTPFFGSRSLKPNISDDISKKLWRHCVKWHAQKKPLMIRITCTKFHNYSIFQSEEK